MKLSIVICNYERFFHLPFDKSSIIGYDDEDFSGVRRTQKRAGEYMTNLLGCRLRIREILPNLSNKESHLATYILENSEQATGLSIDELAQASGVSASTVVRFCRSLNYAGYKDFSRSLFSDVTLSEPDNSFENIKPGDSALTVLHNISQSSIQAIQETVQVLSADPLEEAVDLLLRARRLDLYGMGSSGLVASDAAMKLVRLRKAVSSFQSISDQLLSALSLEPQDAAIIISYTGNTNGILEVARCLKKNHVPIISITRYGSNALSELADIRLHSCSSETLLRGGAMSSRIAQMIVVDTLYAACCSRDFDNIREHLEESRQVLLRLHGSNRSGLL